MYMVNTVKQDSEGFSQQQISQAKTARKFQETVDHPRTANMEEIIQGNLIAPCPVTEQDIYHTEKNYGPSDPILKGGGNTQGLCWCGIGLYQSPTTNLGRQQAFDACGWLFFVKQVTLFAMVSDHFKFATAYHIISREVVQLVKSSKQIKIFYRARGFHVHTALTEREFSPLRGDLGHEGIKVNLNYSNKHMPFKVFPLLMIIYLIYSSTLWKNAFPPKGRVSDTYSPRNIITGVQFDFSKHCQLPFGSYV